eukprot:1585731-Rhodomonas_salina.2
MAQVVEVDSKTSDKAEHFLALCCLSVYRKLRILLFFLEDRLDHYVIPTRLAEADLHKARLLASLDELANSIESVKQLQANTQSNAC